MHLKNFLITGGCGFLGQHITFRLLKEFPEAAIKILDLKPNPAPLFDFLPYKNVHTVVNKNICDYSSVKNELKGIDVVIHCAGIVSFSMKDKVLLENVNICGTRNILKAAQENKVPLFVHVSSVAALGYGDDAHNTIDENFKFDWNKAVKRKKYYMLTKYLADAEIEKHSGNGTKSVILYPGLMCGPGDSANFTRLIRSLAKKQIPFNMPGGTNIIDVRDVARGIIETIKQRKEQDRILLSGYNLTHREIAETISEELGVKPPSFTLPRFFNSAFFHLFNAIESVSPKRMPLTADMVDSAFKYRYFSNLKAKNELGWEPEIPFRKSIKDIINWMNSTNAS